MDRGRKSNRARNPGASWHRAFVPGASLVSVTAEGTVVDYGEGGDRIGAQWKGSR